MTVTVDEKKEKNKDLKSMAIRDACNWCWSCVCAQKEMKFKASKLNRLTSNKSRAW